MENFLESEHQYSEEIRKLLSAQRKSALIVFWCLIVLQMIMGALMFAIIELSNFPSSIFN